MNYLAQHNAPRAGAKHLRLQSWLNDLNGETNRIRTKHSNSVIHRALMLRDFLLSSIRTASLGTQLSLDTRKGSVVSLKRRRMTRLPYSRSLTSQ